MKILRGILLKSVHGWTVNSCNPRWVRKGTAVSLMEQKDGTYVAKTNEFGMVLNKEQVKVDKKEALEDA